MRLLKLLGGVVCGGAFATALTAAPVCPTTSSNSAGADPTGCGVLITFGTSGSPTISITGTGPYDGVEDTTVGVINNSSSTVNSVSITATDASDAFGFEGDGIQTFTANNGVTVGNHGATGYEGPTSTFDMSGVDSSGGGTLVVDFSPGISAGGNSYFSLEGDPSTAGGGITVGPSSGVPEPSSYGLLATGLFGLFAFAKRRFKK